MVQNPCMQAQKAYYSYMVLIFLNSCAGKKTGEVLTNCLVTIIRKTEVITDITRGIFAR